MIQTSCGQCSAPLERHPYYMRMYAKTFCGPECYAAFRRTGSVDVHGYKTASFGGKKLKEHRLIASMKLGRPLVPNESVHHINGDKADNRPENLEVVDHKTHSIEHNRLTWDIDKAAYMRLNGASFKRIAESVGVSRTNVTKQLRKIGISDPISKR